MQTIVCGTDFSSEAREAARVSAAWARKQHHRLRLVHVIEPVVADLELVALQEALVAAQRDELERQAAALRTEFGIEVESSLERGAVFDRIINAAIESGARMIVVAAVGQGRRHGWLLGSSAERVAQHSKVPVLVVSDAPPLLEWIGGSSTLATILCTDMTHASRDALLWSRGLRGIGPCTTEVVYIAWPPDEHLSGVSGSGAPDQTWSTLEDRLTVDLQRWAGDAGLEGVRESCRAVVNWGRIDAAIALRAAETRPALVVVGTHRRSAVARLWQGSVTRGLLHHVDTNIVCVPPARVQPAEVIKRVLAAVDLTGVDADVLRTALGLATPAGEVHVLHVLGSHANREAESEAASRVRELVTASQGARSPAVHVVVCRAASPCSSIVAYAERMTADVICMGTKRRGRAADLVLGSQSHGVLRSASVPVVLVPGDPRPRDRADAGQVSYPAFAACEEPAS